MSAPKAKRPEGEFHFAMLLTLLLTTFALFMLGAFVLFKHGGGLVRAQDDTVGEMLLDEGLRRLEGGAPDAAKVYFSLALKARFEGTKNLRHLHKVWGDLSVETGNLLEAERHYALATDDYALAEKEPALLLEAFAAHAELLVAAQAWAELRAWLDSRPEGAPPGDVGTAIESCRSYYRLLVPDADDGAIPEDWSAAALAERFALQNVDQARALAVRGLLAPVAPVRARARSLLISLPQ